MFDATGRLMYLAIGNDRLYLTSNGSLYESPGAPTAAVAAQGVWRRCRVESDAASIQLFVDGVLTLTAPQLGMTRGTRRVAGNGDKSTCAPGQARFRNVRVLVVEECSADFNREDFVDFFDFNDYITCFEIGECLATTARTSTATSSWTSSISTRTSGPSRRGAQARA